MKHLLPLSVLAVTLAACSSSTAQLTGNGRGRVTTVSLSDVPLKGYTSAAEKFSVQYPVTWKLMDGDALPVNGKSVKGVSFAAPEALTKGTPVLEAKIHVAQTDDACVKTPDRETFNDNSFTAFSWSDSQETGVEQAKAYSMDGNGGCYTVTLYTKTCENRGCVGDTSKPFVRKPVTDALRQIAASLKLL